MKTIGILFTSFLIVLTSAFLHAFTCATLYEWFIMTAFPVPPLGMANAWGIALLLSYVTHQDLSQLKKETDEGVGLALTRAVILIIVKFVFVMAAAWVAYTFFIK